MISWEEDGVFWPLMESRRPSPRETGTPRSLPRRPMFCGYPNPWIRHRLCQRSRQGSNLQPLAPEANALSIELRERVCLSYQATAERQAATGSAALRQFHCPQKERRFGPPTGSANGMSGSSIQFQPREIRNQIAALPQPSAVQQLKSAKP
jgi:hypothetical protein